jgi:O-antigen ligase
MRLIIIVWVISAPLQIAVYGALEGTDLGQILSREEATHLGVGTGRAVLWSSALAEIASNPFTYVFGTGYMSAPSTSVLNALAFVFVPDVDVLYQRQYSLHNAALQILFDTGAISFILFVYCLLRTAASLQFERLNGFIVFVLISGLNEANGSIYSLFTFIPFLAIICVHCVGKDMNSSALSKRSQRSVGQRIVSQAGFSPHSESPQR